MGCDRWGRNIAAWGQDVTAHGFCRGEIGRCAVVYSTIAKLVCLVCRCDAHAHAMRLRCSEAGVSGGSDDQFIHHVRFAVWGRWAFMLRRGYSVWLMCACVHGTSDVGTSDENIRVGRLQLAPSCWQGSRYSYTVFLAARRHLPWYLSGVEYDFACDRAESWSQK